MKKTIIGFIALALLAPVLSNAAPTKHHINKEGGNLTQTSQYRNTPDYATQQGRAIQQEDRFTVKHSVGRNSQSDNATKVAQYQNTPSYEGQTQSGSVAQQGWQVKQPPKHHENRNK